MLIVVQWFIYKGAWMKHSKGVIKDVIVEYIWIDGQRPTNRLRIKTKILRGIDIKKVCDVPNWGFDGSSAEQVSGHYSDQILKPARICIETRFGKEIMFSSV